MQRDFPQAVSVWVDASGANKTVIRNSRKVDLLKASLNGFLRRYRPLAIICFQIWYFLSQRKSRFVVHSFFIVFHRGSLVLPRGLLPPLGPWALGPR